MRTALPIAGMERLRHKNIFWRKMSPMRSAGWGVRKEKRKTMEKKEGKNLIRERIYYAVRLELISPLCVSGGTDQNTDSDVMRNGRGECFIPGTSVAGAFRQYLDPERKKGGIFGYSKGEEGQMSEVIFSDVYFDEPAEVTRRDGVRLTEDRRVETGKKFDWEIIEPGITATLYISYVRRENSSKGGEDKLIQAFLALDAEAYLGLLSFVKTSFSAYYKKFRFGVPEGIHPDSFFGESTGITCQRFYNGMLRIVNVEEALRLCKCQGSGRILLEVTDEMLPQNNGVWSVDFAPGRENQVARTGEKADLCLPVSALSALLCGPRSAREIPWMPEVQVKNQDAPLDRMFYRKMCHVLNLF